MQKSVLGKGLASLLSGHEVVSQQLTTFETASEVSENVEIVNLVSPSRDRHLGISMTSVDSIVTNPFQPRREFEQEALEELCQSIQSSGIIQPLVVRKSLTSKDEFELIAGERRLRAAKMAGLKHVPIVIRKSTDREMLELALIENIQRQDLNCIDEALAYFQLIQEFSLTQEEVAQRVGKDRATVSNYLRLLRLPEEIIEDLKNQILTFGHGKALLGLEDAEARMRVRGQVLAKKMSVRETEALVESLKQNGLNPTIKTKGDKVFLERFRSLAKELIQRWSTKVELKGHAGRGKIVIHYTSQAELDRILEDLQTSRYSQ